MYTHLRHTFIQPIKFSILAFLSFFLTSGWIQAQTDFAPGQIMFTGYNSDDPDGFSFVILSDVLNGTVIYITDRGWSSTTGFRDDDTGEGTISFTFTANYTCGTSFVFTDIGGMNDWQAKDAYGNVVGTVAILTSTTESPAQDPDGIEFNAVVFPAADGDQLFIYQTPEPNPGNQTSFVTGIHMNGGAWNGSNGDDYSSQKPSGLADNQVVRFNTEVDNAKYDCNPNVGSATALQAAIENDNGSGGLITDLSNNWIESNSYISMSPVCSFCCGMSVPATPVITGPTQVLTSTTFTINIAGTLAPGAVWQLFTAGCGVGSPVQTTTSNSFSIVAPGTQQTINYYVRSSEDLDCDGFCDILTVCFITSNLYATCTNCSADTLTCGDCFLPAPINNPDLDIGCYGMRVIFVLDESGSIGANASDVEDGVLAFLNALNGQAAEVALIEFSGVGTVVNNYTIVDDPYIDNIENYFNGIPYNGFTYAPAGGTNWHDAMIEVDALNPMADLVMFFTDGTPTVWNTNGDGCGNGATTQTPEIVNPVKLANKIKSEGTHMFMLGVGGVDEWNLQIMSGLDEYQNGVNTLGTSDYSIGNFQDLAADLEAFIEELCRVDIILQKNVVGPVCNGVVEFRFRVINTNSESAATFVYVTDTFPSGYSNPQYLGPIGPKFCAGTDCQPDQPANAFQWTILSIPPLDTAELIVTVNVLPTGIYDNTGWAIGSNTNTVSAFFPGSLIVEDLPPTISCPPMVTVECILGVLPAITGTPNAIDPDGSTPTLSYTDVTASSGSCPNEYTITRTWTATDDCLNSVTCTQTIVVEDNTPPIVTCPPNVTVTCLAITSPSATGTATASDQCGLVTSLTYSDVTIPGICELEFTVQRTWTAIDQCGNVGSCIQMVIVDDSTPPTLQFCAPNVTITCSQSSLPEQTGKPKALNNCGDTTIIYTYTDQYIIQSGSPPCSILRTWLITDDCGNTTTCIQTIVVVDNVLPVITCPANVTISCTSSTLPAATGAATATDDCDLNPTISFTNVITNSPTCSQEYTITRTWIATDDCGNTSTQCIQTIVVDDSVAPSMTCPVNITIQCSASTLPAATGNATATDNCDATLAITYTDVSVSGSCPQEFTITRTWRATDDCGNSSSCIQTIVKDDSVAPSITCPANVTIQCGANTLPASNGMATATDNCDTSPTLTYTDATTSFPSCPQEYRINRTWIAADDCGNTSTCIQTITLDDSTVPVITCPINVTIQCSASTLPATTGNAIATDNCDVTPSITYTDVSVGSSCPQEFTITRTWRATDDCGNSSTCIQMITKDDSVAPSITCPANITIQCTVSTLPASTGTGTASDNCDATPTITYTDLTMSLPACPQEYMITRTWRATDDCGNSSTCNQIITIDDNTPPAISCPVNVTIQCTAITLPSNTGTATATDNCSGPPAILYTDVSVASPTCTQEYTITRTWRATDGCGNSSSCVQTIVIDDSISPVLTCPANVTIQCGTNTLPASNGMATATDNCDTSPALTYTDTTTSFPSCPQEYRINRTWIAADDCGNISTCIQTITLDDSTVPVITCPVNVTIQCTASTLPANTGNATATDNCDAALAITYTDVSVSGSCPQEFTITRTWSATDDCGNISTCIQTIIRDDSVAPTITCPANVTIECTAVTLPSNTGTATSSDNCDATPTVIFSDVTTASPSCPQEYSITRTWRATDDCGNSSTCLQTILVDDTVPPVLACPINVTIQCNAITLPSNTGNATATDNCSGPPAILYTDVSVASPTCTQEYTITRTWRATDGCGNSSTCVQTIVIDDSIAPVLNCPANITIQCTAVTLPVNTGTGTASDNCDASPAVTYSDVTMASPVCTQMYSIVRTWTAADDCGNVSSCAQMINIADSTPPVITCPNNLTIECFENTLPANTGNATASDICDASPAVTYADVTLPVPPTNGYLIQRTWSATDDCANVSTCLQVISVLNLLDPEILGSAFDTICSGNETTFQAQNPGINPMTFGWQFGSGSNPTMASGIGPHDVAYTYNGTNGSTGAWVLLTLTTPGCVSVTDTVANVHVNAIPNAAIMGTPAGNVCVLANKTFKPQAAQMPGYSYSWTFGAGANIPSAMGYGPHVVEYLTNGSKTVKLIVFSNEEGASCGDTTMITFTVNLCPGNISGRVFQSNGTPIQNANIVLYLDQNLDGVNDNTTIIRSVFTNSLGGYAMASLTPGYYVLVESPLTGYLSLYDEDASEDFDSLTNINTTNDTIPVTVEPFEIDSNNYFVEVVAPGVISGYVFEDLDNNQSPVPIEGLGGVTVRLYSDNDQNGSAGAGDLLQTTTTSSLGYYSFGDLGIGSYVVVEIQPGGYTNLNDFDPSEDNDIVPNTNTMNDTIPVTLTIAEEDEDNYFTEFSPCSGVVTNPNDGEPGSLRYMVDCSVELDTITFHPILLNQILHINSNRIEINKNLYIHSDLNPRLMIQSDINGAFKILQGKNVEFKNINITSGLGGFLGVAFENYGHLTLWDVIVYRNLLFTGIEYLIFNGMPATLTLKGSVQLDTN